MLEKSIPGNSGTEGAVAVMGVAIAVLATAGASPLSIAAPAVPYPVGKRSLGTYCWGGGAAIIPVSIAVPGYICVRFWVAPISGRGKIAGAGKYVAEKRPRVRYHVDVAISLVAYQGHHWLYKLRYSRHASGSR